MQFLSIDNNTTLSQLGRRVGQRNLDSILNANSLKRQPAIGKQLLENNNSIVADSEDVNWERKLSILNTMTTDSDIYEYAALLSEDSWKVLSYSNTFPGMLRIPDDVEFPDTSDTLGNGIPVSDLVYRRTTESFTNAPHIIDPSIFNEYSAARNSQILDRSQPSSPLQWFNLPWGLITLYSSLDGESKDFPVYPEELEDSRSASYDTMPDMLYQYEPWQLYKSSGPRSNVYTFKMHRDMWTGDHRDGMCYQLIRFCEANCYPEFNGASVNTSTVTLYIAGSPHITGVMTSVNTKWDGPLGLDGWYLSCELQLSITEVSKTALNYSSVKSKGLVG